MFCPISAPTRQSLSAIAVVATIAIFGSVRIFADASPTLRYADAIIDNHGEPEVVITKTTPSESAANKQNQSKRSYATTKFEISGKVQGVSFRRYTKAKADELGLMGWCRNTDHGTVEGEYEYNYLDLDASIQVTDDKVEGAVPLGSDAVFRLWLCNEGSPNSNVDGCTFSENVFSESPKFEEFRIIRQ